ncbi:DNA repair protein RecO [Candidatus Poriferisocius sp.]|uniref:DNA repair protein RecO n=1 Tax=Candidatus Poriferisocius sp. TaxID=3101276 RepID=UPI003B5B3D6B
MSLYRDEGIVLRTYRLGEADRIVVFCTRGHGKVRAVAKGVRKTRSRFGGRLEPTSHVQLQLHRGRSELDVVTQTETVDRFRAVREDLARLGKAMAMLEAVDRVGVDREPDGALYRMLLGGLRSLDAGDSALVVPAFYLKLLVHDGVGPEVGVCALCGDGDDLVAFDYASGGGLCRGCRRGSPLSSEALELLRMVLDGRLGAALAQSASAATGEVEHLATAALEYHLERRLRAVDAYS